MSTVYTSAMLNGWSTDKLKNFLKERNIQFRPRSKRKTLIDLILEEQQKLSSVNAIVNGEDLQGDEETITLTRAELKSMVQSMVRESVTQPPEITTITDENETRQKVNDYLLTQAEKVKDSTDRHATSIVRDLKKGSLKLLLSLCPFLFFCFSLSF